MTAKGLCFYDILPRQEIDVSAGATNEYVQCEPVRENEVEEVRYVGVENTTTAYTTLLIGFMDGGVFTPLFQQDSPSADEIYWTTRSIWLREGQRLTAKLVGTTSGDELKLYALSKLYKRYE